MSTIASNLAPKRLRRCTIVCAAFFIAMFTSAAVFAKDAVNTATITAPQGMVDPTPANNSATDSDTILSAPVLSVVKTGPATAVAGASFNYTLTVTNSGDTATSTGVVVQDQLPGGMLATAATGATCAPLNSAGALLICTLANPVAASGGTQAITLTVTAPATDGSITNYAATNPVGSGDPGTPPGAACTNSATTSCSKTSTDIKTPAKLSVVKTGPATAVAGASFNYTLTVTNSGDTATSTGVVVQDQLPGGMLATAATGATCAPLNSAGALLICTLGNPVAASGGTQAITLTVTAPATGGSITNYAATNPVGSGDPPSPPGASCDSSTTSCSSTGTDVKAPQLTLSKTHVGDFTVGTNGVYNLKVSNTGTAPTSGTITVTDALPAGLGFVSGTGTGWTCAATGQDVTCTSSTVIAAGADGVSITLTVSVAPAALGNIINTADVGGGGDASCPAAGHCKSSDPTKVGGTASLELTKTASVADTNGDTVTGDAGDVITYSFSVKNTGTLDLTNVTVSDPKLPTLSCTIASLAAGATATCAATNNTYTITPADVTAGKVDNTATATGTPPGTITPPSTTGSASTPTKSAPKASFTLAKSATVADTNGDTVIGDAGDVITYAFSATNTGTVDLTNVIVSDANLPSLVCTIASLPVGQTVSCAPSNNTHTITPADVTAGKVTNTATGTATPPGTITPPTTSSPPVNTPTKDTPTASLTLTKTASVADTNGDTVTGDAGDVITYSFSVKNTGTVDLTNVTVSDPKLPTLSCTIATLAAGATATCAATNNTYTITAADVSAGKVDNTATATGTPPGTITPPSTTGSASTPTGNTPTASLTLTKTASVADTNGDTVIGDAGDVITYSFSIKNTGTVDLTNVTVSDPKLPTLSCTIATLAAGATATCAATNNTHTITPADVTAGKVDNTATATGKPPGTIVPPTTTGSASTPTKSTPTASFTLAKSATVADTNGDTVLGDAGDVITYSFSATNTGTVDLTNVIVSDANLPSLVCTIASLPVGATVSCAPSNNTYTITAADVTAGKVTNTATGTATPPGTITPPTTISPPVNTPTKDTPTASLTLTKTATVADTNGDTVTGDAGDVITYSFSVKNTGTVGLTNVTVSDPKLPTLSCMIATLAAGATATCTAANNTYTITAADVTAGKVDNTATATGTPPGTITPPSTTGSASTPTKSTPTASFTLAKSASVADTNGDTILGDAGDVITYSFSATNTGTVDLTNVIVSDVKLPSLACTIASLPVGATVSCTPSNNTYTITAADVTAGKVTNTATGTATPPGTITPPTTISPPVNTPTLGTPTAGLTLTKTATVADTNGDTILGDVGDVITYSFSVKNTGTVDLTNVTVSDPKLPTLSCTIATLAAGATATCAAANNTYTITAADVTTGKVDNTATATGTPPGTITPPSTTGSASTPTKNTPMASFTLAKSATVADTNGDTILGDAGDVITYSFSATNTGTVDLTNVVVSDANLSSLVCTIASLPIGATASCASSNNTYTITAADVSVGKVTNTATAKATPPGSITPPTGTDTVVTKTHAAISILTLTKSAAQHEVHVGDVVLYSVVATNAGKAPVSDATIIDTPPAGFSYVSGSLRVEDTDNAGTLAGVNPLRVSGIDVAVGGHATITYALRVGAGVGKGVHRNNAIANDNSGHPISNDASADVELDGDPLFDDSLILGTVFDDRDGDGWQDSAKATGVHVQGGFAQDVYMAGSTTVDRGDGAEAAADHSAPMLHGLALGTVSGRNSEGDPASNHQVVIHQILREPRFTDDFVLTTSQGTTLRMDAAGRTTLERSGELVKGLTSQDISVTRRVGLAAGGYAVDYIVRNRGVDEHGIPGVRVASVEGLIMETDAYGRFHLVGVDGGPWARGRNFILKVDPSTLPAGSVFTTENPRVQRLTPGLPVRFDFGVKLPAGRIGGGQEQKRIDLGEVLFAPDSAQIRPAYTSVLDRIADETRKYDGGVIVVTAEAAHEALALVRAQAVKQELWKRLDKDLRTRVQIQVMAKADPSMTLVTLGPKIELGNVLFDTAKSTIKAKYQPLIEAIANAIQAQGGGVIGFIGRADVRGKHDANARLGLARATAVYKAVAAKLKPDIRKKLEVDISPDPAAPLGMGAH